MEYNPLKYLVFTAIMILGVTIAVSKGFEAGRLGNPVEKSFVKAQQPVVIQTAANF